MPTPTRLIAIGDVHGCPDTLSALLEEIEPRPDDQFVFLGDYIDRGPDSKATVELIIELCQNCLVHPLMGNHEEMCIASRLGKSDLRFWMTCGGKTTIMDYGFSTDRVSPQDMCNFPPEHQRFYGNLLDYYETDTHIFVHASYDPTKPLAHTSSETLRWANLDPLIRPHSSGKTVICGHSPGPLRDLKHVICIDTGCGKGGKLTGLDVNSGQIWQVDQTEADTEAMLVRHKVMVD